MYMIFFWSASRYHFR